jgi:hypothetical protein
MLNICLFFRFILSELLLLVPYNITPREALFLLGTYLPELGRSRANKFTSVETRVECSAEIEPGACRTAVQQADALTIDPRRTPN